MFSKHVSDCLKSYVYRLIDPRNGETFYVGKGVGNRVFQHARGQPDDVGEPTASLKLHRIREIQLGGFVVQHVIHRHGMDDGTAQEVEAALIDAYQGLTNEQNGRRSGAVGVMHADEIIETYEAKELTLEHQVLMITINKSAVVESVYEAVRYAWKLDVRKASRAEFILAIVQGLVVGVFVAEQWLLATPENFEGRPDRSPRYGFRGQSAPDKIQTLYLRKRVPMVFRKPGAANPVKYGYAQPSGVS